MSQRRQTTSASDVSPAPENGAATGQGGYAALEERLGYRFADVALLRLAMTHRSVMYEARGEQETRNHPGTDNEQLEFLGDAVLGLVVSELLVEQFPERDEGELTRIRAALVSRKCLGALGEELGLGDHLLLGRSAEASGARRRPALLANTVEAVIAAMYLDAVRTGAGSGAQRKASATSPADDTPARGRGAQANEHGGDALGPIRALARKLLLEPETPAIEKALAGPGRGALRDHKTLLQERVQAEGAGRLRYVDVAQSGPAHDRRFSVQAQLEGPDSVTTVLAEGEGTSKREAQQQAAERALEAWGGTPAGARVPA